MILEELLEGCVLLPEDKIRMLERGFLEEDIEKKRWKSCQPNNARLVQNLIEKYGIEECLRVGIVEQNALDPKNWQPNNQLLEPNILIPYLAKDGTIEKLRPHRLGFAGQPAIVYRPASSYEISSCCIVAEGEFKADAAEKYGYASIAIPGIKSMSSKNWDYFVKVLKDIRTKEFVILFDTEIKDDPHLPKFKPNWRKRYDTIIYAYAMCQKTLNVGFQCRIGMLPYEWMEDGKIDIDLCLKQKRSLNEFKNVIDRATTPPLYLEACRIPQDHKSFVTRKVRSFFSTSDVSVINNCFYIKKGTENKKLANCSIKIQNVYEELGAEVPGVKRDITIVDEYGFKTKPLPMVANNMASKGAVVTWLMAQGNYLFYGEDKDVIPMWEYIFDNDEGDLVYLINRCGYIKEFNFWLFKNILIKDGQTIEPDENGVFWLDQIGYKPNKINEDEDIPSLSRDVNFDINLFLSYLSDTVDAQSKVDGLSKAIFAWILAVIFLDEIYNKFKMFPILFLYGPRGSGKTTIVRWLAEFLGMGKISKSLAASSPVGITRLLSYYGNLPLVVDDWRDDEKSASFTTLFLGVYNRQVGAKGVKAKFGLQQTDIRAALALMGEELISDSGLFTRCVSFIIPSTRREERYDQIENIIYQASGFVYKILTVEHEKIKSKIIGHISQAVDALKTKFPKIESRLAYNYGILLGTYKAVMGNGDQLEEYLNTTIQMTQRESKNSDKIHRFAEEFNFGHAHGLIHGTHFKYIGEDTIVIWIKGVCDVMNKFYSRREDHSRLLLKYMQQYKFYMDYKYFKLDGMVSKVYCAQLNLNDMSDDLRAHFECAKAQP